MCVSVKTPRCGGGICSQGLCDPTALRCRSALGPWELVSQTDPHAHCPPDFARRGAQLPHTSLRVTQAPKPWG